MEKGNIKSFIMVMLAVFVLVSSFAINWLLGPHSLKPARSDQAMVAAQDASNTVTKTAADKAVDRALTVLTTNVMPLILALVVSVGVLASIVHNRRVTRVRGQFFTFLAEGKSPEQAFASVAQGIAKTPKKLQEVEKMVKKHPYSAEDEAALSCKA